MLVVAHQHDVIGAFSECRVIVGFGPVGLEIRRQVYGQHHILFVQPTGKFGDERGEGLPVFGCDIFEVEIDPLNSGLHRRIYNAGDQFGGLRLGSQQGMRRFLIETVTEERPYLFPLLLGPRHQGSLALVRNAPLLGQKEPSGRQHINVGMEYGLFKLRIGLVVLPPDLDGRPCRGG
ncbi:hypothetical protein D1872_215290 [compost metagenome]